MVIGLLASGLLGEVALKELIKNQNIPSVIFTDNNSPAIIEKAKELSIKCFIGNPRSPKAKDFIEHDLLEIELELIISVNYLYLIDQNLISLPKLGCVNLHGSLLPKYRGRTPHVWAIINNEKKTGITAHYIDSGCDTGNVIIQKTIEITRDETGGGLLNQFESLYPELVSEIIEIFKTSKPKGYPQNEDKATYFGKRSPEDGQIDWNWQKERIYNWVRAQAAPYPGAFTYYEGKKVSIDLVEFTETGFNSSMPNGLIVKEGNQPEVKTSNGVIQIKSNRSNSFFEAGKIFK
ncbi:MAG: methionyl-tRNA formyltransferase [Bacteroidota bacterium]